MFFDIRSTGSGTLFLVVGHARAALYKSTHFPEDGTSGKPGLHLFTVVSFKSYGSPRSVGARR